MADILGSKNCTQGLAVCDAEDASIASYSRFSNNPFNTLLELRLAARNLVPRRRHMFGMCSSAPDAIVKMGKSLNPACDRTEADLSKLCGENTNATLRFAVRLAHKNWHM